MHNEEKFQGAPLLWGQVGGGRASQIGYIHRCAAQRDNNFKLVAGAFDINPERGADFGQSLGIEKSRCYSDYTQMFQQEALLDRGIQAVSIATPNNTHFEICLAALQAGLHVICEKPLCFNSKQADLLHKTALEHKKILAVTYGYSGAQMLHQAKHMIAQGDLGDIRVIRSQFAHGFHSQEVEADDPGTKWRVTPEVAGPTYVLGDVGTHALFLIEMLCPELKLEHLLCSRQSFVKSRVPLEDNAFVLMKYHNGAVGELWASAINAGSMHQQKIRVVGSKASIEWWDEHPNQLRYEIQGQPVQILERGMGYLYKDQGIDADRIGAGHAEGLFESWANLYHRFGVAMRAIDAQDTTTLNDLWYPNVEDGIQGVRFLEKCVESADNGSVWVACD